LPHRAIQPGRAVKILLIGKNGQVGAELAHALPPAGEVIATDRTTLDLTDPAAIARVIRAHRPEVIINAAAYTAVDKAESDAPTALAVNAVAPGVMASEARALGALLIHYSTDYVFDGSKAGAYVEDDKPCPLGVYGRSKLEGELHIRQVGCRHLILRTSWVYGPHGANFLRTMLRFAGWFGDPPRAEVRVVDDQVGSPTTSRMIAEATAQILARMADGASPQDGVYHMTSAGQVSWCGFARAIFAGAGLKTPVVAIPTSEYSVLDNSRFERTFLFRLPAWEAGLEDCLASLFAEKPGSVPRAT
jgi:dTDP-4-dehydrorhamnose reductase